MSTVSIPQSFHPDNECYDTSVVSGKKFYRNIQSTPWSSKSGLAGKDVGQLRVVDLTRKGLDDYALRNLSNGEFQSVVFVRSVSEAVFTTNLLRMIRQDRLDIDGMAAHLHGAAPPDKHRESARFMEPLLGEVLRTLKSIVPVAKPTEQVNEELERAKRKLQQAGSELTPPAKRRQSQASEPARASTDVSAPLPVVPEQSPAEAILSKAVTEKPVSFPTAVTQSAMDKWLKAHQAQFKGQTVAFKKHVAQVCTVLQISSASKAEYVSAAARYALNEKLAGRMSITNLSTFIAACQYEAA